MGALIFFLAQGLIVGDYLGPNTGFITTTGNPAANQVINLSPTFDRDLETGDQTPSFRVEILTFPDELGLRHVFLAYIIPSAGAKTGRNIYPIQPIIDDLLD